MTKASLEMLQGGYDTSVGYLSDPAVDLVDPKTLAAMKMIQGAAKLAVPLVDGALDQLGKVLAAKCPDQAAVTKALSDAALAQRAQNKVLNLAGQPAAVNPTAAPAPAPAN
ncbi:MAG: hypothetical protein M1438_01125 [Deltaproteobacteria bacterium]|nr:hypothetical protein [Deltaproteobacteria bacterium]